MIVMEMVVVVVGVAVCGGGLLLFPKFLFRTVVRPKLPDFLLFAVFFLTAVLVAASSMLGSPTSFLFVVSVVVGTSGTGVLLAGVLSGSTGVVLGGFAVPVSIFTDGPLFSIARLNNGVTRR